MRCFVICLFLVHSISWAQDNDILGYEIENSNINDPQAPANSKKVQKNTLPPDTFPSQPPPLPGTGMGKLPPGTGNLKMEDLYQTWNARKVRQGFGYSPLLNVAQYDRWLTPKWGFFVGIRYQKSFDSFSETKTTSYTPTTLALTETTQFTGARNPTAISLLIGGKNRIWQNDWVQVNWGPLLSYTHGTSVSYSVGNMTRTVASVNTPNDYSMTETGLGTTSVGVDPTFTLGVKVGSEIYIKWFPNLSLCGDIVFLNQLPLKGTQESSTSTRTFNVVSGVPQSPTTESYSTTRIYNDFGGAASTSQVGSAYFNLLGANWSIKYVW